MTQVRTWSGLDVRAANVMVCAVAGGREPPATPSECYANFA